jgi:hypothetical protein
VDAITCMKVPPNWVCSFILLSCLISTTANYNYVKAFKTWMKFIYMCILVQEGCLCPPNSQRMRAKAVMAAGERNRHVLHASSTIKMRRLPAQVIPSFYL